MKIEYFEGQYGLQVDMKPETPAEVAQLLRLTKNAKAIKPEIKLYFESDTPSATIWLRKVQPKAQKNSISNP